MKYIDSEKLIAELTKMQFELNATYRKPQSDNMVRAISLEYDDILSLVDSLQQECEILEFSFKGGTYRVNGEEHAFNGGKAKVIILEINQEEEHK